jgi:hypothetical protein
MNVIGSMVFGLLGSIFGISLGGCYAHGSRLYQGPALPPSEVAVVLFPDGNTRMNGLRVANESEVKSLWTRVVFEVLPGEYVVNASYVGSKMGTSDPFPFSAKAGHRYVLYPTFSGSDQWKPVLVELDQFHEGDCRSCSTRNELEQSLKDYWLSSRPAMKLESWGGWI